MSIQILDAAHYHQNSATQVAFSEKIFSQFSFSGKEHILDIGCGSGTVTARIAKAVSQGSVLGIDPSHNMIAFAQQAYPNTQYPNLHFQVGMAEALPTNRSYDVVTAMNCLHWLNNLDIVFKSIHNILTSNGQFIGLTYPKESTYWQIILETAKQSEWKNCTTLRVSEKWLDSAEFLKLLMVYFNVKHFEVIEETIHYSTRESLQDYIKGWLPCMIKFNHPEKSDHFLEQVSKLAWHMYSGEDNGCYIPYTKLSFKVYR